MGISTDYSAYIGPSIRGVIQSGTLYAGTREDVIAFFEEAIARYPRIKTFIVSGSALPQAKIDIKKPGTYMNHEYRAFKAELKQEGGMYHA